MLLIHINVCALQKSHSCHQTGQSLKEGRSVPRYFFTIHGQDRVEDDPDGTYLPDVAAALSYAEHTIRELRKESGYKDDLALMMIVTDHNQTVLSLPFFPGC
jgi:hypothetical protein